ncbi:MAG: Lrp/AsnC family transcriptional regulator [Peptococcaceae bacterium]|nr:Lrp/AsnC family transcriptional regulator [Candidatus Syntrophopropionicum ammoniitolerans]
MLLDLDRRIIKELQNGLPLTKYPYRIIAGRLKISESKLMNRVEYLIKKGVIRRLGAAVRHQELGFTANAMVVWDVPDNKICQVGTTMAEFREVTHCYQRPRQTGWPYNLFAMIHGQSREECIKIAEKIARVVGIDRYRLLFSTAELKKTSMRYFE